MGARPPLVFTIALLLSASSLRAQTDPIPADVRAERILAKTGSGREGDVVCDSLDGSAQALIDLATKLRPESLERATVAFRLAERAARCAGSKAVLAAALVQLSEVLLDRAAVGEALAAAIESREIYQHLDDSSGLATAWNAVGYARYWKDDVDGALADFQRSLELAVSSGNRLAQGRVVHNMGHVLRYRGEYVSALDSYTQALHIFEEIGERRRAASALRYIAVIDRYRGEYADSLDQGLRSLQIGRAIGDQQAIGAALDTMGETYRLMGAYDLALQSFEQALQTRMAVGAELAVMETAHNLGLAHFARGDYELAIDAFKRALHLKRELRVVDESLDAEALRNIGAAAWRLGQHDRAVANFRESLSIARRAGLRPQEAELLSDLGQVALEDGRLAQSAHVLNGSLAIREGLGDRAGVSATLAWLARARLAEHRSSEALDLARRALDYATTHDVPDLLWPAQTAAGTAYLQLGQPDAAKAMFGNAIQSIERLTAGLSGVESFRGRFFENKLSPYHELIGLLLEQHAFGEALEVAERSKARVLTRLLRATRDDYTHLVSADERHEQTRLRDRLRGADREIDREQQKPSKDADRVAALEASRRAAREAIAAFDITLLARHPQLAIVRGEVPVLRVSDARSVLSNPATAILEYVVADRHLFAFLVTTAGGRVMIDARTIDVDSGELTRALERFRVKVSSRDFSVTEDARRFYSTLLGPFGERLGKVSRIIVVPDGPLWNVPFQALLGPDGYVIEAAAVSYAPSITALREIMRLPKPSGPRTLFAMGKSQFESRTGLEPLPDAAGQVRVIRDLYGAARSAAFVDAEATESRFKADAPGYSVLHLATHGVLDEASPLYSHLVLSRSPDGEEDGRLEAWEIMRMKLDADLVVLAACETGRGRIAPGEGMIGMMWALFAAGARSMVVSQFRVESRSATSLLVAFHTRVAGGGDSKAAQLRAAALTLLHNPKYGHPYYWSGFILVGDSD